MAALFRKTLTWVVVIHVGMVIGTAIVATQEVFARPGITQCCGILDCFEVAGVYCKHNGYCYSYESCCASSWMGSC